MSGAFRKAQREGRFGGPFSSRNDEGGKANGFRVRPVEVNGLGTGMSHPHSSITPGHVRAFQAVRSQLYDNITLAGCVIDGTPGVAIVMVDFVGEDKVAVMPLFVAITGAMNIEFGDEIAHEDDDGEEDGGPDRSETLREFALNKEAITSG